MKHVIVGTAGHIDHGKTALVKALTGIDADRLKEEKERGITIDIGFADLPLDNIRIGFVDVPGHERFVKNMLAGAHGLDLVMLIVSADESIMPQTREHFDICRLLNLNSGIIAVTKSDLVDAELLELARAEVEDFVKGSFLEGAPIISVSSRTGQGIEELKSKLAELADATPAKTVDAVMRLPIDRVFSVKGFGTVVTGTLIAGEIKPGDELEILPAGIRSRVRNLQVHGQDAGRAVAGQRTAVNLQGVNVDQIERGAVLAPFGRLLATMMLDVHLQLLPGAPRALTHRARVRFHHGTAEVMARCVIMAEEAARDTGPSTNSPPSDKSPGISPARLIEPGQSHMVQMRLESPIAALPGDRFILRSYSPQVTIGGGVIIDAHPAKYRVRSADAISRLRQLQKSGLIGKLPVLLQMAGARGLSVSEIAIRTGATDRQIDDARSILISEGRAVEAGGSPAVLLVKAAVDELSAKVVSLLAEHHKKQRLSLGLGREEVRERVFGGLRLEIFRTVLQLLSSEGKIDMDRELLRLPTHKPMLEGADSEAKAKLENTIKKLGLQAVSLDEAAAAAGISADLARKLFTLLQAEGRLHRIADFVFHTGSLEDLKSRVRAHKPVSSKIDVAVFKDLTGGLSRKYAIPLLEYLDRERVTRRIGNEREIL